MTMTIIMVRMMATAAKSRHPRIATAVIVDDEKRENTVIVIVIAIMEDVAVVTIVTVECHPKIGIEVRHRQVIIVIVDLHHKVGPIMTEAYLRHRIMLDDTVVVLVVLRHEMIGDLVVHHLLIREIETCGNGTDFTTDVEVVRLVPHLPQDTVVEEDQDGDPNLDHVAAIVLDLLEAIPVTVGLHHDQGQDQLLDRGHPVEV
mmetsp:Transcript_4519/g.6689  ORF Transcript_4519/g.6689 Transcript_4519/m.6689 type:complete len:202 (+) Transcript_4519:438-1043(+)